MRVLILLSLVVFLTACGNKTKSKFIDMCTYIADEHSSKAKDYCGCNYDKLESKYGREQMEIWMNGDGEQSLSNPQVMNDIIEKSSDAAIKCAIQEGLINE